ncbi:MAG: hypothetical protein WB554_12930 [Desulfomonilaceae bacterium]
MATRDKVRGGYRLQNKPEINVATFDKLNHSFLRAVQYAQLDLRVLGNILSKNFQK